VALLALTGSTLSGLFIGASALLVGILVLLFAAYRRRRRERDELQAGVS